MNKEMKQLIDSFAFKIFELGREQGIKQGSELKKVIDQRVGVTKTSNNVTDRLAKKIQRKVQKKIAASMRTVDKTDKQKEHAALVKEVLNYEAEHGTPKAAEKFEVGRGTIIAWKAHASRKKDK